MSKATLSTHVLDLENGQPAAGLTVTLLDAGGGTLMEVTTDDDGRAGGFPELENGTYGLRFDVHTWFTAQGRDCFYPEVTVAFKTEGERPHYHVPLLLNRYGYSTYRGS